MTVTAEPTSRAGASPVPPPTTDPLGRPARWTARWRLVVCLAIVVGALGWVAVRGLTGSFVYYLTPTDISVAHKADVDQRVRLGGYVVPGSLHREPSALRFAVSDGVSTMRVLSTDRCRRCSVPGRASCSKARSEATDGSTPTRSWSSTTVTTVLPSPGRGRRVAEDGAPGADRTGHRARAGRLRDGRRASRRPHRPAGVRGERAAKRLRGARRRRGRQRCDARRSAGRRLRDPVRR